MKILLLGGTGAIGRYLTKILSDRGEDVVVTSRSRSEIKGSVKYRKGNAKKLDFLNEILKDDWDAIVDFMIYSTEEFNERLNLFLSSTFQYFFLSSARVYDESKNKITENYPRLLESSSDKEFLSTKEYSLEKARQENILFESDKNNWTIIRPYITYSERRLQLGNLEKEEWLYRALKGRTIVFSEDIKQHLTTLTYGLDVAAGISNLINNQKALGEVYHITNGCTVKWKEILNIYLNVLEKELGYCPDVIYQNLSDFLGWNQGEYQIKYDRLFDRDFDNSKINKFINTEEFLKVQIGLKKCLTSFLRNPSFKQINWKKEAIKDRYTNERTSLKEIDGFKQKIKYIIFRYLVKPKKQVHT